MSALRVIPDDFPARVAEMNYDQLRLHYKAGNQTVSRWMREAGLSRPKGNRAQTKRPVPTGFAKLADLSSAELQERYNCSKEIIRRWRAEVGVVPVPHRKKTVTGNMALAELNARFSGQDNRPRGVAERAADVLRPYAPVYRCTDTGRADFTGKFWRYGTVVVTDAELIERAERKGFQADAWRQLNPTPAAARPPFRASQRATGNLAGGGHTSPVSTGVSA